jgi:hypothetical protein
MDPDDVDGRVDVLAFDNRDGVAYRSVAAGHGEAVVVAHEEALTTRRRLFTAVVVLGAVVAVGLGAVVFEDVPLGLLAGLAVLVFGHFGGPDADAVPEVVLADATPEEATDAYDVEYHSDDPFDD